MKMVITTDGSAVPNPGPTRIGVLVEDDSGNILAAFSEESGFGTSNTAEYKAIIRGLTFAKEAHASICVVYTDSQLCERQLNGLYDVRKETLIPLYNQVKALEKFFTRVRFRWRSREEGRQPLADALAAGGSRAMEALRSIEDEQSTNRPGPDGRGTTPGATNGASDTEHP